MKATLSFLLITEIILIQFCQLYAQTETSSYSPYLDSVIPETMKDGHIPGLSACIIKDGQVRWTGAYGNANIELGIPVETSTLFHLASVSKTVSVTALMQLWEEGKFEMDNDINKYLDFEVRHPRDSLFPITFHMLCTHTSGIKDNWSEMPVYWNGDSPIPLNEFLYNYLNEDGNNYDSLQNFYYYNTPGTVFQYSNIGATLIGYLVERIGDPTFSQQTHERIFEPLQMNETAWFVSELDTLNIAMPYKWNGNEYIAYGHYGYSYYPAGSLRTSVDQLANFLLCYMKGGTHLGQQILESSTVDLILTPQVPQITSEIGLIWQHDFFMSRELWGHGGSYYGTRTGLSYCKDENTGILILNNGENDNAGWQILDLLFDYAADSIEAQCLPEGITFTTQEEIDNFQSNYPGCTEIEGDVEINGDDITNLNGLNILSSIGGELYIHHNEALTNLLGLGSLSIVGEDILLVGNDMLTSLIGLESLTTIEGDLRIGSQDWYWFLGNISLKNLHGLDNLTTIGGGVSIVGNHSLNDLSGMNNLSHINDYLEIGCNDSLTNLSGLVNITSINGYLRIGWWSILAGSAGNNMLNSLIGINTLNSVGGIFIAYNPSLDSMCGFDGLTSIDGDLFCWNNDSLVNIEGLYNITSIGGNLFFSGNDALTNLTGLDNLNSIVGNLNIANNDVLTSIAGLKNIEPESIVDLNIYENISLSACEVQSVCEYLAAPNGEITIHSNADGCMNQQQIVDACESQCLPEGITFTAQDEIDNFQSNYPGCTEIEGDVTIAGDYITNLGGLSELNAILGSLKIENSGSLETLTGLDNLTLIGADFYIRGNNALMSLTGLENLISVGGDFEIGSFNFYFLNGNISLEDLEGLENLSSIGGRFYVLGNHSLLNLSGIENLSFIGSDLTIGGNDSLVSLIGLENVTSVEGDLNIGNHSINVGGTGNPALTSLAGLEHITYVAGELDLSGNPLLDNFSEFINLDSIGGNLLLTGNTSVKNMEGFNKLSFIGGGMWVMGNSLINLIGLDSLTSIGGSLDFYHNDSLTSVDGLENLTSLDGRLQFIENYALKNLEGLANVTTIGGSLFIRKNTALTSLAGLDNITAASIEELYILENSSLSICEIQSVCDYLASPNGAIGINGNGPNCDSLEVVLEMCRGILVEEIEPDSEFSIYPNPFTKSATLEINLPDRCRLEVKIFNQIGRLLNTITRDFQNAGLQEIDLETGDLEPGIYFCVLKTNEGIQTMKMIKL